MGIVHRVAPFKFWVGYYYTNSSIELLLERDKRLRKYYHSVTIYALLLHANCPYILVRSGTV